MEFITARRAVFIQLREVVKRGKSRISDYFREAEDGYSMVLKRASLLSLVLLLIAMGLSSYGISAMSVLFLFVANIILGLYVFAAFIEKFVAKKFIDFKSTRLFWVGVIAFMTYAAHGQAGEEINSIFSQDASAFPYATTAATAMIIVENMFWPTIGIVVVSFFYMLYKMYR